MGIPSTGDVVIVPFPFTDLSRSKVRPAAVLADVGRGDWPLCQITSNPYGDPLAIELTPSHFSGGSLRVTSYVRPGKLFTANETLIGASQGRLNDEPFSVIIESVIHLLRRGLP